MNTLALKSTAPKCRMTRFPFSGFMSIVRRYQSSSFASRSLPTPESGDSIANGTRILPRATVGAGSEASNGDVLTFTPFVVIA